MNLSKENKKSLEELRYQQQESLGKSLFYWLIGQAIILSAKLDDNGNIFVKDLNIKKVEVKKPADQDWQEVDFFNPKMQTVNLKYQGNGVSVTPRVTMNEPIRWKIVPL